MSNEPVCSKATMRGGARLARIGAALMVVLAAGQVGAQTAVRFEVYTDRAAFQARLGGDVETITFDDIDASGPTPTPFASDHYRDRYGVVISGAGGQYVHHNFTWGATDYFASSAPNMYAPGPPAAVTAPSGSGGNETNVTFVRGDEPAGVSGFGAVFIDADFPTLGASNLAAFDRTGMLLGDSGTISGANGSRLFRGVIAIDEDGRPTPAIYRVQLITGSGWPEVNANEGVTLDDFVFDVASLRDGQARLVPGAFSPPANLRKGSSEVERILSVRNEGTIPSRAGARVVYELSPDGSAWFPIGSRTLPALGPNASDAGSGDANDTVTVSADLEISLFQRTQPGEPGTYHLRARIDGTETPGGPRSIAATATASLTLNSACPVFHALTPIPENEHDALELESHPRRPPPRFVQSPPLSPEFRRRLGVFAAELGITDPAEFVLSSWRPRPYTEHLYEAKQQYESLNAGRPASCDDYFLVLHSHIFEHHQLAWSKTDRTKIALNPPGTSWHEHGEAADLDETRMRATGRTDPQILEALQRSELGKPCPHDPAYHVQRAGGRCRVLTVERHSPINILVTDPLGRRLGFDPMTGLFVNEIGSLTFSSGPNAEPQILAIGNAVPGRYVVTGIGTGTGPYTVLMSLAEDDGAVVEEQVTQGTASLGQPITNLAMLVRQPLGINVKPGSASNTIDLSSRGAIPVAIMSTASFSAPQEIQTTSLRFGATGEESSLLGCYDKGQDVDGDGRLDLMCYFDTRMSAFGAESQRAYLTGLTKMGVPVQGEDAIRILPAPKHR